VLAATSASAQGADGSALDPTVEQAAKSYITRAALEAPIRFLASDALEGRGPATRADQIARLYLQTELEGMGYQPGGPGGQWQQPFDVVGIKASMPATWSFQAAHGNVDLKWRDDYIAASGEQNPSVGIDDAELVFVGYGIQAPEYKWDDFKGVSLKGKVLVMLNNDPDWDPKLFAAGGKDLDKLIAAAKSRSFKPVPLGLRTSIKFTNQLSLGHTANVAGLLRGSDPRLADEVVIYSAHHDHFGIGEPDSSGDRIYHGTVDNASGSIGRRVGAGRSTTIGKSISITSPVTSWMGPGTSMA
jgi:hypothetical protein